MSTPLSEMSTSFDSHIALSEYSFTVPSKWNRWKRRRLGASAVGGGMRGFCTARPVRSRYAFEDDFEHEAAAEVGEDQQHHARQRHAHGLAPTPAVFPAAEQQERE